MSEKSKQDDSQSTGQGMQIEVGHLSVTGHVVFAGRDGSVNVTTGGDVEQTANASITVGGVETSRQDYDGMVSSIRDVQKTIKTEDLEASEKAAAEHNLKTIETQLTAESVPNPHVLSQATKLLYRASPRIAGELVSLFSNPLVGQIVESAGEAAISVRDAILKSKKAKQAASQASNNTSGGT